MTTAIDDRNYHWRIPFSDVKGAAHLVKTEWPLTYRAFCECGRVAL